LKTKYSVSCYVISKTVGQKICLKYISILGPTRCTICFQFIMINSLYMFQAIICSSPGGTADIIRTKYINCFIYSAAWQWENKCSKHVEAINRNKLKANSASCWSYGTNILWYTVNKTLTFWHRNLAFKL
jgi:hypothetical protein